MGLGLATSEVAMSIRRATGHLVCESQLVRPLATIRNEVAIVRTLADEVERLLPSASSRMTTDQLAEEVARLACQLLEAASTLRAAAEARTPREASMEASLPVLA